jgi:hypothetical protein
MADAYMEGVDAWSGHLSVAYRASGPDNLHGPLWSFNALGQSIPIIAPILDRLAEVSTEGRAQWWLVLATALIWNENTVPTIPGWTPSRGGGGVYVQESAAAIYGHGYLEENHSAIASRLNYELVLNSLKRADAILNSSPHQAWSLLTLEELQKNPDRISLRINRLLDLLAMPDLGGVLENPLEFPN